MKPKILKPLILLFGISLLLVNCQKDDDFQDRHALPLKGNISAKRVTLNEIKKNELLKQSISKIEKQFDYNKINSGNARINATDNSFVILTDEIIEVATDTTIAYTFKIETPTNPESSFENFVITRLRDTDYQFHIYRYEEHDLEDGTNDFFTFSQEQVSSEQVLLADFNDFFEAKMFYDTASGCFIEVTQVGDILLIDITDCGDLSGGGIGLPANFGGGNFGPWVVYDPNGDGICKVRRGYTNMDGMPDYQTLNFPVPCNENFDPNYGDNNDNSSDLPWDNNDDTGNNSDPLHDGGGGQSNNSDTISNNIVTTIGVIKDEKSADQIVIDCVGATNLTSSQSSWLSSNPFIAKKMASMIAKSKCHVMGPIILGFLEDTSQKLEEFVENELECYGVQTLMNNTGFTDALDALDTYTDDPNEEDEHGFEVSKINETISISNEIQGSALETPLNHGGNIIGGMHAHTIRGNPIFSEDDIYKLYAYYRAIDQDDTISTSPHDVFSVVATENGTYMIKINDYTLFRHIILKLHENTTHFLAMKDLKDLLNKNIFATSNEDDYLRSFLLAFKTLQETYNMPKPPLKLYKLNTTTNTFDKIVLDSSNYPEPQPCQ